jgi:CRP/FNR family transcriptional regulator
MKTNSSRQHEEALSMLRMSLGRFLHQEMVEELIERHIAVTFEKGAMAFCEGNADGMLACVLSGYVNVYCAVGDGNRTLVRLAGPGEVIGYADYIDEKGRYARMFEAQIASKCTLALFSRDHIVRLLSTLPSDALISVISSLNTFWSENLRYFATLLNLPFWNRLTLVMSDLAKRAGVKDSEGIILIPEIGHEGLSEMIGCSRPMVTRLIAEMVQSGSLARRGKQYVLLKKWNFNENSSSFRKMARRLESVSSGRSVIETRLTGGSSRAAVAYVARGSS